MSWGFLPEEGTGAAKTETTDAASKTNSVVVFMIAALDLLIRVRSGQGEWRLGTASVGGQTGEEELKQGEKSKKPIEH